ncbi:DNA-binding protein [Cenarchaeum symbiosum A]|uniref:DNA-binding protein CENSYa_1764 n=1 Tax=Cenarchaeum symbiosum (strain A) TaxID=414004 RepID=Y1764_CENSY|nr:RecName: Full=DNA-binding protein CENSYa_1764 [Cenarchaeum symbiosum A]ABK78375.1 DNA-binding protein [Cenarchaeum symbiosum A]
MSYTDPDDSLPEHVPGEAEMSAQKEAILKQILEPQARMRLSNIRMVKPETAAALESHLINAASQGRLAGKISDEHLKQILQSMQKPRREFKINRR